MKFVEPRLREERRPSSYCLNFGLMFSVETTEHVRVGDDSRHSIFYCLPTATEAGRIVGKNVEQFCIRFKNYPSFQRSEISYIASHKRIFRHTENKIIQMISSDQSRLPFGL